MIYSIGVREKHKLLEKDGRQLLVYIPAEFGPLIKELCGSYPSRWDNAPVQIILPKLHKAIETLAKNPFVYDYYADTELAIGYLNDLVDLCEKGSKSARLEVDW